MLHILEFISRTGMHEAPSVNAVLTGGGRAENHFKTTMEFKHQILSIKH